MRTPLLLCLLTVSAFAQSGKIGIFSNSDDIGAPPIKGSAEYDAASGQYTVTGSGSDIWAKADQFHYLWKQISGDFTATATVKFLTGGNDHRKASIMLRQTLDTDSPFFHIVIHGNGMPGIQFRPAKNADVNTVDMPVEGPGTFTLKMVRKGSAITVWFGKDGAPLQERGDTQDSLGSPVMIGLGVASHTQTAVNTVLFSDVSIEPLPAPAGNAK